MLEPRRKSRHAYRWILEPIYGSGFWAAAVILASLLYVAIGGFLGDGGASPLVSIICALVFVVVIAAIVVTALWTRRRRV